VGTDGAGGVLVEVVQRVPVEVATGRGGGVVVRPRGAVVVATVDALTVGLDRVLYAHPNVVLELSAVTALDPAGAAVLAARSRDLHAAGSWLVMTRPSPAVRVLLDTAAPGGGRRVNNSGCWPGPDPSGSTVRAGRGGWIHPRSWSSGIRRA